ncbi:NmrA-like family protein [Nemania abortiva]|nr:NmrA-like family protein [Nemania abortiva]
MAPLKNVVVVGASNAGQVRLGSYIVDALKTDPELVITVISRTSTTAQLPEGVKVIRVSDSYRQDELEGAFAGQDAVVMSTGFQLMGQEGKFIEAAVKAGVKRFIPSEFGSNTHNPNTVSIFPMTAAKAKVVGDLRTKESRGLTWTAICTNIFFDIGLTTGFMGYDIKEHKAIIWDDGSHKFSATTRENVAKAVLGVLRNPEITANQYVYVSSFEVSQNEVLSALENVQGVKYAVTPTTTEKEIAEGKAALEKKDFMEAGRLLRAAVYNPGYGNNFANEAELWNDKIGVPREDLGEIVGRLVKG